MCYVLYWSQRLRQKHFAEMDQPHERCQFPVPAPPDNCGCPTRIFWPARPTSSPYAAGSGSFFRNQTHFPSRSLTTLPSVRGCTSPNCPGVIWIIWSNGRSKKRHLWNEVKDRLHQSALGLSGGQQQRLCIARAIAVGPEILLMDEPCSALDPASTSRIEDLIFELRQQYTIVIVTHNMQQAARCSDRTAFFFEGNIIEEGATEQVFTRPKQTTNRRLRHRQVWLKGNWVIARNQIENVVPT